jgi:outer membrane protein assembly factor BamB
MAASEAEREVARSQAQEDAAHTTASRSVDQLIFVGLNGYALALDRDTGQIVWSNSEMNSGYVSLLLDGDRLIVSTNGYIYCLDPLTGKILWHNPLTGFGMGAPTHLISVRGQSSQTQVQQAAQVEAASQAAHAGGS